MGITFHTQKENYVYHSKNVLCLVKGSTVKVEFATPPIEGIYFMVWQIMKKDGTPAFPKNRKLEVLLNLI